jgi:hypothetical protein
MTKTFGYCRYNQINNGSIDDLKDYVAKKYGWGSGFIDYPENLYYEVCEPANHYFFFDSRNDYINFKSEIAQKFPGLVDVGPFYYLPKGAQPVIM